MAAKKQDQALTEKLTSVGYPDFEVKPGEDDVPMLHIAEKLIGSVEYALSLSDAELKALIDETLQVQ
jgi:hypothetical protein